MNKVIAILIISFLFGCSKQEPPVIQSAARNTEELHNRVLRLAKEIPFINYSTLPSPTGYAESGVNDLVLLGGGLRKKFELLNAKLKKSSDILITEQPVCSYKECKENYKLDRRINRIVYSKASHVAEYRSEDELLLSVNFRYSPYYSKFHILGYQSPLIMPNNLRQSTVEAPVD